MNGRGQSNIGTASSLQQNVSAEFKPESVLQLPNLIPSVNGQSAQNYQATMPMDAMLKRQMGAIQE